MSNKILSLLFICFLFSPNVSPKNSQVNIVNLSFHQDGNALWKELNGFAKAIIRIGKKRQ